MYTESIAMRSASVPDEQTFLQAMYKEQCEQARQHETLRQQSTTLIFALAGTMGTVSAWGITLATASHIYLWAVPLFSVLGIFIAALAWFGRHLSLKHYERN